MSGPTPLLDFFRRGEAPRDVRLLVAQGGLAPRAGEQVALLIQLLADADGDIRDAADQTLSRIPHDALTRFLARPDVPTAIRDFFAARGVLPAPTASADDDQPLVDPEPDVEEAPSGPDASPEARRQSVTQQLTMMTFPERLKAAVKGSREMRAILIRDPNKMIAAAVLSSPKVSEPEIATYARMANLSEDILRIIASNRAWVKNYGVVVGLTKNPKTPLALSLNLMSRLNDRDLSMLSIDRNVPEPLRIAARKRVVASTSGKP
jgi:hypothetical protein